MNDERMSNLIIKEFSGKQCLNVQLTCILGNIFGEVEYVGWKAHQKCNLSLMYMLCTSTSVVSTTQLYSPNKVKQKTTMCTHIEMSLPMEHTMKTKNYINHVNHHSSCNLSLMYMLCTTTSIVSTTQLYSTNKVKQKKTMCTHIEISLRMEHTMKTKDHVNHVDHHSIMPMWYGISNL